MNHNNIALAQIQNIS